MTLLPALAADPMTAGRNILYEVIQSRFPLLIELTNNSGKAINDATIKFYLVKNL